MPPAYEVLLLNTTIPQIQAAQSGDTYVVPRDIAINATAIISANSATDALRITQTGAGNAILVEDSANPDSTPFVVTATGAVGVGTTSPITNLSVSGNVAVGATGNSGIQFHSDTPTSGNLQWLLANNQGGNNELRLFYYSGGSFAGTAATFDKSGNLGLGVTPSANWNDGFVSFSIKNAGNNLSTNSASYLEISQNVVWNSGWKYVNAAAATRYEQGIGTHAWFRSTSTPVIGNDPVFSQAMTLDASGNLGVGTTNPLYKLHVNGNVYASAIEIGEASAFLSNSPDALIGWASSFSGYTNGTLILQSRSSAATPIVFATGTTSATERARITSGGYFKASNDGAYINSTGTTHEFNSNAADDLLLLRNSNASAPYGIDLNFSGAAPDNNTQYFFRCRDNASGSTTRCIIWSDGDLANHDGVYGTISDQKLKQDIVDAGSQWNDIKAIRFRKYRMKSDVSANPDAPALLGVIAQELEQVSPGLVDEHPDMETVEVTDEDGNVTQTQQPTGTTTKTVKSSILLMKAAVALQEAMARIEKLEAEVAALKGA